MTDTQPSPRPRLAPVAAEHSAPPGETGGPGALPRLLWARNALLRQAATGGPDAAMLTGIAESIGLAVRDLQAASARLAGDGESVAASPLEGLLTEREREILELVAEGRPNAQIARTLWVTEQTVKFHLSNVYRKLGVANRTEASRLALRHGLIGA
jgi:DNA-binding NarL/FixJ family response regulator